jgi:SOS-response transcriptional repressor LexA
MSPPHAIDTTSACHRVLTAIRQYRREHGCSPSLGEIARRTRVRRQHVGRYLASLQADGYLIYDRAAVETIKLADPAANLSDLDLELACHGRGWTVVKSRAPAIVEAYPIETAPQGWEVDLLAGLVGQG